QVAGQQEAQAGMARRRGRGVAAPMAASDAAESGHAEQPQGPQRMLTRREFVVTAAATAAVAGCAPFAASSAATRKPDAFALTRPATVTYDTTIPAELASVVASALAGHGGVSVAEAIASTVPPPDFLLTFGAAPKGFSTSAIIGASAWALATHLRVPVDEITHAQAQGLLSGVIGDWSAVGAP